MDMFDAIRMIELKIVAECEECGYEIAKDETHISVDGAALCMDDSCFTAHAKKALNPIETTA